MSAPRNAAVAACHEVGGVIFASLSAKADAPRVPEGLVPLRSVEIDVPETELLARLSPGEQGLLWSGDLAVLVQPIRPGACLAHVLVRPGTDARAASRAVERLRRECEGG